MRNNHVVGTITLRTACCLAVALAILTSVSCGGGSGTKNAEKAPETAVSNGVNGAKFVSMTGVPSKVTPGQVFSATLVFQNSGTSTWQQARHFRLGNTSDDDTWGFGRLELPTAQVAPGETATWLITFTAPAKKGEYPFAWRILQEGVEWFGDTTPVTMVSVK